MLFLRANPLFAGREDIFAVYQNHFGSQCATECVYRHLPAKVKLTRSHFGKPPLTECVLRHPLCQSELAEAPTTFCGTHESPSKTKATGRSSARAKMPDSLTSRQYTMIFFVPVRGVSLLRAPTTANKTQRPTVTENKMAFCKKWKQMADRNGTPLASGGRGNWTWRSPP